MIETPGAKIGENFVKSKRPKEGGGGGYFLLYGTVAQLAPRLNQITKK